MEPIILTPRLEIKLLATVEPGSQELNWIHELRSNKQSAFWNLGGPAKTVEQTQDVLQYMLPQPTSENGEKIYRIPYMIHEILPNGESSLNTDSSTRFIGLVTLRSLTPADCSHQPRLGFESTPTTLTLEIAYTFLPTAWGHGYATEAITEIFAACQRAGGFYAPYKKLSIRAIVNGANKPSQRVMGKCGMGEPEEVVVEDHRVFVAGEWQSRHELAVYGRVLDVVTA